MVRKKRIEKIMKDVYLFYKYYMPVLWNVKIISWIKIFWLWWMFLRMKENILYYLQFIFSFSKIKEHIFLYIFLLIKKKNTIFTNVDYWNKLILISIIYVVLLTEVKPSDKSICDIWIICVIYFNDISTSLGLFYVSRKRNRDFHIFIVISV